MAEEDYIPWVTANGELGYIATMLEQTELYGAFKVLITLLINVTVKRLKYMIVEILVVFNHNFILSPVRFKDARSVS